MLKVGNTRAETYMDNTIEYEVKSYEVKTTKVKCKKIRIKVLKLNRSQKKMFVWPPSI